MYAQPDVICDVEKLSFMRYPSPTVELAKYSLIIALITDTDMLILNAVNKEGTQLGSLSVKNILTLPAPYDFIRSRENGFKSLSPLCAFTATATMLTSDTTAIFAAVGESANQSLITGDSATIGMALKAESTVSPPKPHLGDIVASSAVMKPINEPITSPANITKTVFSVSDIIVPKFALITVRILVGLGSCTSVSPNIACNTPYCHTMIITIPNNSGNPTDSTALIAFLFLDKPGNSFSGFTLFTSPYYLGS
jgi:hypothetical protein